MTVRDREKIVGILRGALTRVPLMKRTNRPQGMAGGKFYANGYEQAILDIAFTLGLKDQLDG